jgi:hypothetical protein
MSGFQKLGTRGTKELLEAIGIFYTLSFVVTIWTVCIFNTPSCSLKKGEFCFM